MYDVFGDESCGSTHAAYGLVVFENAQTGRAEKILGQVKAKFGGTPADALHCRELFAGDARRKTKWAHLDQTAVHQLYECLFREMSGVIKRSIAAIACKAEFPASLPAAEMDHIDPNYIGPRPGLASVNVSEKFLATQCAMGALIPVSRDIGPTNFRFWPDPDRTMIDWFDGRRSIERALSAFIQTGPNREALRLQIKRSENNKPKLLELADCIAYVAQRRANTDRHSPNGRRFNSLMRTIDPMQVEFTTGIDGGFQCKVPNASII